jgi:hypothetical protein
MLCGGLFIRFEVVTAVKVRIVIRFLGEDRQNDPSDR